MRMILIAAAVAAVAASAAFAQEQGGGRWERLFRADSNNDGAVTRAEFDQARAAMFTRIDADRDGRIERGEHRRGHRGGPGEHMAAPFPAMNSWPGRWKCSRASTPTATAPFRRRNKPPRAPITKKCAAPATNGASGAGNTCARLTPITTASCRLRNLLPSATACSSGWTPTAMAASPARKPRPITRPVAENRPQGEFLTIAGRRGVLTDDMRT